MLQLFHEDEVALKTQIAPRKPIGRLKPAYYLNHVKAEDKLLEIEAGWSGCWRRANTKQDQPLVAYLSTANG